MIDTSADYIGVSDMERLLNEGSAITLIDARSPEEFAEAHVPGAINVPIAELKKFAQRRDIESAGFVVTMCGSSGRGEKAATVLASQDISDVMVLQGGLKAWRDAGLAVVESR